MPGASTAFSGKVSALIETLRANITLGAREAIRQLESRGYKIVVIRPKENTGENQQARKPSTTSALSDTSTARFAAWSPVHFLAQIRAARKHRGAAQTPSASVTSFYTADEPNDVSTAVTNIPPSDSLEASELPKNPTEQEDLFSNASNTESRSLSVVSSNSAPSAFATTSFAPANAPTASAAPNTLTSEVELWEGDCYCIRHGIAIPFQGSESSHTATHNGTTSGNSASAPDVQQNRLTPFYFSMSNISAMSADSMYEMVRQYQGLKANLAIWLVAEANRYEELQNYYETNWSLSDAKSTSKEPLYKIKSVPYFVKLVEIIYKNNSLTCGKTGKQRFGPLGETVVDDDFLEEALTHLCKREMVTAWHQQHSSTDNSGHDYFNETLKTVYKVLEHLHHDRPNLGSTITYASK